MINGKSVLAVIPARGGSKGLPRKNISKLADKPLIAWTIESANGSKYIDRSIVSTDDQEIADTALKYNGMVPFLRPSKLATDDAKTNDVLFHIIEVIEEKYDILILLQPTSPLRNSADIDKALELMEQKEAGSLVSMVESRHPIQWTFRINEKHQIPDLVSTMRENKRRQDYPQTYALNGAIYISKIDLFIKEKTFFTNQTIAFLMPIERSIDIDDKYDFEIAKLIVKSKMNEKFSY